MRARLRPVLLAMALAGAMTSCNSSSASPTPASTTPPQEGVSDARAVAASFWEAHTIAAAHRDIAALRSIETPPLLTVDAATAGAGLTPSADTASTPRVWDVAVPRHTAFPDAFVAFATGGAGLDVVVFTRAASGAHWLATLRAAGSDMTAAPALRRDPSGFVDTLDDSGLTALHLPSGADQRHAYASYIERAMATGTGGAEFAAGSATTAVIAAQAVIATRVARVGGTVTTVVDTSPAVRSIALVLESGGALLIVTAAITTTLQAPTAVFKQTAQRTPFDARLAPGTYSKVIIHQLVTAFITESPGRPAAPYSMDPSAVEIASIEGTGTATI